MLRSLLHFPHLPVARGRAVAATSTARSPLSLLCPLPATAPTPIASASGSVVCPIFVAPTVSDSTVRAATGPTGAGRAPSLAVSAVPTTASVVAAAPATLPVGFPRPVLRNIPLPRGPAILLAAFQLSLSLRLHPLVAITFATLPIHFVALKLGCPFCLSILSALFLCCWVEGRARHKVVTNSERCTQPLVFLVLSGTDFMSVRPAPLRACTIAPTPTVLRQPLTEGRYFLFNLLFSETTFFAQRIFEFIHFSFYGVLFVMLDNVLVYFIRGSVLSCPSIPKSSASLICIQFVPEKLRFNVTHVLLNMAAGGRSTKSGETQTRIHCIINTVKQKIKNVENKQSRRRGRCPSFKIARFSTVNDSTMYITVTTKRGQPSKKHRSPRLKTHFIKALSLNSTAV
jgi:hypothetical protein